MMTITRPTYNSKETLSDLSLGALLEEFNTHRDYYFATEFHNGYRFVVIEKQFVFRFFCAFNAVKGVYDYLNEIVTKRDGGIANTTHLVVLMFDGLGWITLDVCIWNLRLNTSSIIMSFYNPIKDDTDRDSVRNGR